MMTANQTYTTDTYFKVLGDDRITYYSGYQWPEVGEWTPQIEGDLEMCATGYHAARGPLQLLEWLSAGPHIYTVELRGDVLADTDKVAAPEARLIEHITTWNERTARLFAADCAERVLHIYEAKHPDDARPRHAIETARRYANGEATADELAAAWDAAWAAAWAAAWDAAWAAAWDAAGAAARVAAVAAGDAERQWQADRLLAYLNDETTEMEASR